MKIGDLVRARYTSWALQVASFTLNGADANESCEYETDLLSPVWIEARSLMMVVALDPLDSMSKICLWGETLVAMREESLQWAGDLYHTPAEAP